jgi:hypothetical protein
MLLRIRIFWLATNSFVSYIAALCFSHENMTLCFENAERHLKKKRDHRGLGKSVRQKGTH